MQEVYKTILNDTDLSLDKILKSSSASLTDTNLTNLKGNKMLNDCKNAETSFLFDLCIFAELGNAKNNLICVSFFLINHLRDFNLKFYLFD